MADSTQEIILGLGKFTIDDIEIALTRGGGTFEVTREYRVIEADGMKAAGKDMITIDREDVKLTFNALTLLTDANISALYPAMTVTTDAGAEGITMTSNEGLVIGATDYHTVKWEGVTNKGKAVTITIEDAVNLESINWAMVDKSEIIQTLTYTATADVLEKQAKYTVNFK